MEGEYPVYWGEQQVGKVRVRRQGLYYRFQCRCRPGSGRVCRLRVHCGNAWEDLGILVPAEDGFGLETSIPAKRFPAGEPAFFVVPKVERASSGFLPVYPEEPFAYISRLKDAYLVRKNGVTGIAMK